MQGPVEWETDRLRFLGRGRGPEDPVALDGRALSGTTGAVLDPIVSLRQRIRLAPGGFVRHLLRDRHGLEPRGARWRWRRSTTTRAPRPAPSRSRSPTRRARCGTWASRATRPCCTSASRRGCSHTDGSLRAAPEMLSRNVLGQPGLWAHGISGDLPILLVRVVEENDIPLVRQVLQAQEYWRLKGLSADVVILNEHPVSYLDEMHVQLTALLDTGPWGAWKHRPGGVFLLRGDRMSEAERVLLTAAARAILSGERGELANQLDRPICRAAVAAGTARRRRRPRCRSAKA